MKFAIALSAALAASTGVSGAMVPPLNPAVIATGFANDGQDVPAAGQVPSLTSTNNFINFCLTVPNTPITNGRQITTGSCNPAPIGVIPSVDRMPSAKFTNPKNGDTIPANQAFTITMAVNNLETGAFTNAQQTYFGAPQRLNGNGVIIGHSHVVVDPLQSLDQTTPTDPKAFAFFKGLNEAAQGGVLKADLTAGLPAGAYRLCSINSSSNHQPVIVAVAQHGSLDDCIYFTASNNAGNNNGGANQGNTGGANGGQNNNNNNNGQPAGGQQNGGQQNGGQQNGGQQNGGQQNGGQQNGGQQNGGQQNGGQQNAGRNNNNRNRFGNFRGGFNRGR
ncbi:hypothetical protein BJ165DRAFT_511014 [Panaeolus papilionaceus]|nr:hypothetical protein BJ165DRAFT_511014 [Panaeolus papilionaceus]